MNPSHDPTLALANSAAADPASDPGLLTPWAVIVPVKVLARAKSRLAGMAGPHRERLALAMATDTVAAALTSPRIREVIVVTDDPVAAPVLSATGARIVSDEPDSGLNPALRHGAAQAHIANHTVAVAALSADLPALRPNELTRALDIAMRSHTSFVPDAAGIGTTLYAAAPGCRFHPEFGTASRERHSVSGAEEIMLDGLDSLRRDVDTAHDLAAAVELGVGERTGALLHETWSRRA